MAAFKPSDCPPVPLLFPFEYLWNSHTSFPIMHIFTSPTWRPACKDVVQNRLRRSVDGHWYAPSWCQGKLLHKFNSASDTAFDFNYFQIDNPCFWRSESWFLTPPWAGELARRQLRSMSALLKVIIFEAINKLYSQISLFVSHNRQRDIGSVDIGDWDLNGFPGTSIVSLVNLFILKIW